jgi:RNA polymerase sigma-70 factor (ECF subfamily)
MEQVQRERMGTRHSVEVDLIVGARSGDQEAFGRLMAGRMEPSFRTAMAILGHEADARDATQEAFVKAWRELRTLRDAERFDAWFGRILVNTCRTALRRRSRSQAREIRMAASNEDLDPPMTRSTDRVEDHIADIDLLERAFERLAAEERALLVLHHLDRRPISVIAATFGIPEGTAKSRLHAARRTLERAIEVERR